MYQTGIFSFCIKMMINLISWMYGYLNVALSLFLGDIDPEYNVVEVTDEAKEKLAKIDNKIGDFVCQLCKSRFDDAFGLAQHR